MVGDCSTHSSYSSYLEDPFHLNRGVRSHSPRTFTQVGLQVDESLALYDNEKTYSKGPLDSKDLHKMFKVKSSTEF